MDTLWAEALPSGVRKDVHFLRGEFLSICDAISDREPLDEPAAKEWILAVREIAYDVEDYVDLLTVHVDAAAGIWGNPSSGFRGWLLGFARMRTALPSVTRHIISNELKNHKERLIELKGKRHLLYEAPIARHWPGVDPLLAMLHRQTDGLVGLTGPVEEVTKMVTASCDKHKAGLMTVSIVGMAGSGKTTLANQVYMRLREENCFQCQAFVSVGQKPDLKKTIMLTLSMVAYGHRVDEDIENLTVSLKETLEKKRYLIVVDDLWSWEHWKTMKRCFPENSLGSRIIITTRNVIILGSLVKLTPKI